MAKQETGPNLQEWMAWWAGWSPLGRYFLNQKLSVSRSAEKEVDICSSFILMYIYRKLQTRCILYNACFLSISLGHFVADVKVAVLEQRVLFQSDIAELEWRSLCWLTFSMFKQGPKFLITSSGLQWIQNNIKSSNPFLQIIASTLWTPSCAFFFCYSLSEVYLKIWGIIYLISHFDHHNNLLD